MYLYIYNLISSMRNTVDSLRGRRAGISPSVDNFLKKHGNEPITQMTISRTVLNPLLTGAIGGLSPSFRRKTQDMKRYHLHVLIRTTKTSLSLKKNAQITIGSYQKRNGSEDMTVSIPPGLSLNSVLERTHSAMGGKFLPYSVSNNCQDFILSLLASNNLATPTNTTFVKQSTQSLIPENVRKVSNTITGLAGGVDKIIQGGDIIKPVKKSNAWVQHVLKFAFENKMNYIDALQNLKCRTETTIEKFVVRVLVIRAKLYQRTLTGKMV
jgi:hypothetical protein